MAFRFYRLAKTTARTRAVAIAACIIVAMDLSQLLDIFLHLDKHLVALVDQWGPCIYAALFLIIFVETGLVVMPFLPGDSLLFVCGAIAAVGGMDLPLLMALLSVGIIFALRRSEPPAAAVEAPEPLLLPTAPLEPAPPSAESLDRSRYI